MATKTQKENAERALAQIALATDENEQMIILNAFLDGLKEKYTLKAVSVILTHMRLKGVEEGLKPELLAKMRLDKEEMDGLKADKQQKTVAKLENAKLVRELPDYKKYIYNMGGLLRGNTLGQKIIGIVGLTGRRLSETLVTGEFRKAKSEKPGWLDFAGQGKKQKRTVHGNVGGESHALWYEIPCLGGLVDEVIAASKDVHDHYRQGANVPDCLNFEDYAAWYNENALSLIDHTGAKMRSVQTQVKVSFAKYGNFLSENEKSVRALRKVYGAYAYLHYCPERTQFIHFLNTILGHDIGDYATTSEYLMFKL